MFVHNFICAELDISKKSTIFSKKIFSLFYITHLSSYLFHLNFIFGSNFPPNHRYTLIGVVCITSCLTGRAGSSVKAKEFFLEKKEPFTLKELEKMLPDRCLFFLNPSMNNCPPTAPAISLPDGKCLQTQDACEKMYTQPSFPSMFKDFCESLGPDFIVA